MKFQLKTLAAAAILAVAAGQASAAILAPTTTAAALVTGSEVVFFAFDSKLKKSYELDLGITYKSFINSQVTEFTRSVAGTNWTNFVNSVGGDFANVTWGVVGMQKGAAGVDGGQQVATTVSNVVTAGAIAAQLSSGVKGAVAGLQTNFNANNGTDTNAALNKDYFSNVGSETKNWNYGLGATLGSMVNVDNKIGAVANFWNFSADATSNVKAVSTQFAGSSFAFDGNTLTYSLVSAVPEPSTYAMMAAGLMLVGGIAARRRKSAK